MRVFVTGATGLNGTALIKELLAQGHTVSALARTAASAERLKQAGVSETVHGDVTSVEELAIAASKVDAVIHAAFNHDIAFTQPGGYLKACEQDRAAIAAMCDALIASTATAAASFIYYTGTLGNAGPDEKSGKIANPAFPRYLSEELVETYAAKGIHTINLQLPPVVHGPGYEHPFITSQIPIAKKSGVVGYVDAGSNVWASAHVNDVARLCVLALDAAPAGATLHAVAEDGIPTKDIAAFIAKKLDLPTRSVQKEEAAQHFGQFIGPLLSMGQIVTTAYTREWTGWAPREKGLFATLENYAWK